jgi:CRP-like cAMP-binding protein
VRAYGAGEALAEVGAIGPGLTIILAGHVDITQHDQSGRRTPIVSYGPGEPIARHLVSGRDVGMR